MAFVSARDKVNTAAKNLVKAQQSFIGLTTMPTQIANLKKQVAETDALIAANTLLLNALSKTNPMTTVVEKQIDVYEYTIAQLNISRSQLSTKLNVLVSLDNLNKSNAQQIAANAAQSAANKITTTGVGAYKNLPKVNGFAISYNASSVKEAYFSTRTDFINRVMKSHNQPTKIKSANELWTSAKGSKGMIVTSEQVLKAWNSGSNRASTSDYFDRHNYGFQFQYNPGTVGMTYFTSPNVDVTLITSGTEMFNLAGVSGAQGSINFQIIINRIFDMQYYDDNGNLKDRGRYLKPPANVTEEKSLYNKGTMYDIEYLLRVLMGTTMSSYLRGENTADMGWLPAIPVELHLGKSLRYLGTINSLNVNHQIFNERMVPLFTTVDIAFARLPDYPPTSNTPNKTA